HVVGVQDSDYLRAVLDRAEPGAGLAELTRVLLEFDPEASPEEAEEFLTELIDQQVLIADLYPRVTGSDDLGALSDRLRGLPGGAAYAEPLDQARTTLAAIDRSGPGAAPSCYREVERQLAGLPAPIELAHLVQVDLIKPARAVSLGPAVLEEVARGV